MSAEARGPEKRGSREARAESAEAGGSRTAGVDAAGAPGRREPGADGAGLQEPVAEAPGAEKRTVGGRATAA
ncbi:hypothetical protein ACIBJB_37340, partial [Streptomyces sp. NPDC050759]